MADDYWRSFGPEFSDLIYPRIRRVLRKHGIRPRTLLDLGCGTGSFAIRMAAAGLKVMGLDSSDSALRLARQKAKRTGLSIRFVKGDMRSFSLSRKFDVVTAIFNTVNHLLSRRDLWAMFRSASQALHEDGFFIFDVNHRNCFEEVWGGTSLRERPHYVLIRRNQIHPRQCRATARLTLFFKDGNRVRVEEDRIEERWYTESAIRKAAQAAAFQVIHKENFNPFPRSMGYSDDIKSLWVLQKSGCMDGMHEASEPN